MAPPRAAFPEAEHRARLARARGELRSNGIDVCLCVAPENLFYLAGYDSWVAANGPQALVFSSADGDPVLVVRDVDRPLVAETSWIGDVRAWSMHGDDPADVIAHAVAGMDGPCRVTGTEALSSAMPLHQGRRLERALAPARLVDVTGLLGGLRWRKSPRELDYMRRAAAHAEAGLAAMRRTLRPGITETALAGEIEAAMRRSGSDYWAIPTELSSGARSEGGHATPGERVIEPGDLVHAEFAGVDRRYHAVAIATMAAGAPDSAKRELHDMARRSLEAGIRAIRPGVAVAEVEEASLEPLRRAGLEDAAMMRFGYGVGVAYPPVWLETLQVSRGVEQRLGPGMTLVLHACVTPPGSGLGAIAGGTWLLADDGLHMLSGSGAAELEVVCRTRSTA